MKLENILGGGETLYTQRNVDVFLVLSLDLSVCHDVYRNSPVLAWSLGISV